MRGTISTNFSASGWRVHDVGGFSVVFPRPRIAPDKCDLVWRLESVVKRWLVVLPFTRRRGYATGGDAGRAFSGWVLL